MGHDQIRIARQAQGKANTWLNDENFRILMATLGSTDGRNVEQVPPWDSTVLDSYPQTFDKGELDRLQATWGEEQGAEPHKVPGVQSHQEGVQDEEGAWARAMVARA